MPGTLVGTVRGLFAIANVVNNGVAAAYNSSRGFLGPPVRNGLGDVTLTLQDGLLLNSDGGGTAKVTVYGAVPLQSSVEQVDSTHLRVRTNAAGDPTDAGFSIELQDVGPT